MSTLPAFDETHAPFLHQGAIRHFVTALKFAADYPNARLLGQLLAEHLQTGAEKTDVIMPVPLHPRRYRERGFNQSLEIARNVGKILQIPLDLNSCRRSHDTPRQSRLNAKQRRRNVKRAFELVRPPRAESVAILDDVMTTGSTAQELALLLKKAGVARVAVWVCARA